MKGAAAAAAARGRREQTETMKTDGRADVSGRRGCRIHAAQTRICTSFDAAHEPKINGIDQQIVKVKADIYSLGSVWVFYLHFLSL